MSVRGIQLTGRRRLAAIALSVAVLLAVVAVSAALVFNTRTAHGSGTGGGGCFSTTGPACTFTGNNMFADFNITSPDDCIFSEAEVSAFDSLTRPGHNVSQGVLIFLSTWDECNGVLLANASNFDPSSGASSFTGTIQFGSNLSSATINGTAPMYDQFTGSLLFTTTVNLTVKGFGPTSKFSDSQHFHSPGFIMNSHFTGTSRSAEVTGTFTDGAGNNLVALPSLFAELQNSQGGTVQIFPV